MKHANNASPLCALHGSTTGEDADGHVALASVCSALHQCIFKTLLQGLVLKGVTWKRQLKTDVLS